MKRYYVAMTHFAATTLYHVVDSAKQYDAEEATLGTYLSRVRADAAAERLNAADAEK